MIVKKTKLPVIILRNMSLLPHGELKLEINLDDDKIIINNAINKHNSYVLLVSPKYITDEDIDINELPKIGIIGKITSNFELPNGDLRLNLIGINRANIFEFIERKDTNTLDAIIGPIKIITNDKTEEEANLRILKEKFASYVTVNNNISNILISKINEEQSLEKVTDIIVNILPLTFEEKIFFVNETSSLKRAKYLIDLLIKESNISKIEKNIESELQTELDNSQKEYILREKLKVIKEELNEKDSKEEEIEELINKVNNLECKDEIKNKLYKEIERYKEMPFSSPELTVTKNYIDTMLSLPFNKLTKDETNLKVIEKTLDLNHYGLTDVKERIVEYIAVKKLTKGLKSPILCLVGPPGVGKTSLAISISKALKRKFIKMSVGGISDESEIIGHRKTYVSAEPGRIISSIIKAGCNNPLFLIDEIDKMCKGINGDPTSAMLEVLDPEQNKMFYDNFIEEAYDLSNVFFILTANYIEDIPYPLLDRLEIIELSSYTIFEKVNIVKDYLFNEVLFEHGLLNKHVLIDEDTIKYIIENYTKEAGVRELKRVFSKILRKIAKNILIEKNTKKVILTKDNIRDYLGKEKYLKLDNNIEEIGVVNGMGYTPVGGVLLPIEVSEYKGNGNIILTGSLGEVMKESANISIGYIKSNLKKFKIKEDSFSKNDIHINAMEAGIKKDGPSAGVALTTAIISCLTKTKIPNNIAMTGEITLKGKVLPIGGLKEKIIGAYNSKANKIFIPKDNESDLELIEKEVIDDVEIILVSNYDEIYDEIFKKEVLK